MGGWQNPMSGELILLIEMISEPTPRKKTMLRNREMDEITAGELYTRKSGKMNLCRAFEPDSPRKVTSASQTRISGFIS